MRWLVLAVLLAGCQIDARSDDYRCGGPEDCTDGRMCIEGWCVLGADPDAGIDGNGGGDAGECPAVCTECVNGTCIVRCEATLSCSSQIMCPPGMPCQVICSGDRSCTGGVSCGDATSCDITCSFLRACGGLITCGAGPCTVACTGDRSCNGAFDVGGVVAGIDCTQSCACDVTCSGPMSCSEAELCPLYPETTCARPGNGCTSTPATCNTCP